MRFFFSNLLILISLATFSQSKPLQQEYAVFFDMGIMEINEKPYPKKTVNQIPANHVLAELINDNRLYVDYIYTNYALLDKDDISKLLAITDSVERNAAFIKQLTSDTLFNKYFHAMVKYYLGKESKAYAYETTINIKDTISIDSLVSIASHFFYLNRITKRGCHWAICVGKNGYRNSIKDNGMPLIEAFCFNAIMNNVSNEEYDFYKDFTEKMQLIKPEDYEGTPEDVLEKMRNTMFRDMQNSKSLRRVLLDEYLLKKGRISFVLEN